MASLGRSFKPQSYLSTMAGRRPGLPGRSMSNTSISDVFDNPSASSSPGGGEVNADDSFFSARPSPSLHGSPRCSPLLSPTKRASEVHLQAKPMGPLDSPRAARSRPIAIRLPSSRRSNTTSPSSVRTPPAPLSARGEIPGGYFPLHEEQNRTYVGHPFQLDVSKARQRSIQRASQASSPESALVPVSAPAVAPVPSATPLLILPERATKASPANMMDSSDPARATTPVTSYIPCGAHGNPLPMGKYYPTNYEQRKARKREQQQQQQQSSRPSATPSLTGSTVKSDSQVPSYRGESQPGHVRNESQVKRRLQQYQRDMIAQATLALNSGDLNTATLNTMSLRNMGFATIVTKPSKPRLAPLGSPGPVTPMELESSDAGYLGVRANGSPDAQVEELSRAIRAEERRCREGASSPAVETGTIS